MRLLIVFILATSAAATSEEYPKADGGFRGSNGPVDPRSCDENWIYIGENGIPVPAVDGCLPGDMYPPYMWGDSDLADPGNPRTDTNYWCSFKQRKLGGDSTYELADPNGDEDELKIQTAWGYCLRAEDTSVPTTPASPTPQPTEFFAFADGGFVTGSRIECDQDWTYRDTTNQIELNVGDGCLDGSQYPPYLWGSGQLALPKNGSTDVTRWCSIKSSRIPGANTIYDVNPGEDLDEVKRRSWGYCLDSIAVAATQPTTSPTIPSASPTMGTQSPTGLPESSAPTSSAGEPGVTSNPTMGTSVTGAPTPETTTQGNSPSPQSAGLSSGEVAAAVIVPIIVILAAVAGFAYYKYKTTGEDSKGDVYKKAADGEEQEKDYEKGYEQNGSNPVNEAGETKEVEEIRLN